MPWMRALRTSLQQARLRLCAGPQGASRSVLSLARAVGGKTRSCFLTAVQAEMAGQQIGSGHEFRERVDAYWEACEEWADQQLDEVPASSGEGPKKGLQRELQEEISQQIERLLGRQAVADWISRPVEMAARR